MTRFVVDVRAQLHDGSTDTTVQERLHEALVEDGLPEAECFVNQAKDDLATLVFTFPVEASDEDDARRTGRVVVQRALLSGGYTSATSTVPEEWTVEIHP